MNERVNSHTTSATNKAEMYDAIDQYIAEIYDRTETQRKVTPERPGTASPELNTKKPRPMN